MLPLLLFNFPSNVFKKLALGIGHWLANNIFFPPKWLSKSIRYAFHKFKDIKEYLSMLKMNKSLSYQMFDVKL